LMVPHLMVFQKVRRRLAMLENPGATIQYAKTAGIDLWVSQGRLRIFYRATVPPEWVKLIKKYSREIVEHLEMEAIGRTFGITEAVIYSPGPRRGSDTRKSWPV
jgi:hypothetical protein